MTPPPPRPLSHKRRRSLSTTDAHDAAITTATNPVHSPTEPEEADPMQVLVTNDTPNEQDTN